MKKVLKWIGLIFAGLLIISVITAKEIKAPKGKSVTAFNQDEEKYKIGDVVTIGELEYKIEELFQAKELENANIRGTQLENHTEFSKDTPGRHFEPDSVFLIVKIKITNIGEKDKNIYPSMFKLVENDGTENEVDVSAGVYIEGNDDFFSTHIDSKLSKTGYVVFDIPTLKSSYALKISGGQFSSREEFIYFTNEELLEY